MPEEQLISLTAAARLLKRDSREVKKVIDCGWFRPDASYQHGGETRPLIKETHERLVELETILRNQEACREWTEEFEARPENRGMDISIQRDQLGQLASLRTKPQDPTKEERFREFKREEPLMEFLEKKGVCV